MVTDVCLGKMACFREEFLRQIQAVPGHNDKIAGYCCAMDFVNGNLYGYRADYTRLGRMGKWETAVSSKKMGGIRPFINAATAQVAEHALQWAHRAPPLVSTA